MILRVQAPVGTKRIEVEAEESAFGLVSKIKDAFNFDSLSSFNVYKEREKKNKIKGVERVSVSSMGLRNGDMIFVNEATQTDDDPIMNEDSSESLPAILKPLQAPLNGLSLAEDEVDIKLWQMSGLIERPKDEQFCRHGANGKCFHCTPFEPYDESYLKDHNIKHMSFHSYLRKMTRGIDKGKFAALENIRCRIKLGCTEHLPWPKGICTRCQPSAITLNRQVYRHVDNLVFENALVVESFLDFWRKSGNQRIGYLYGRYEVHSDVPLGIKATVVAIYEPPQQSDSESIGLTLPDPREQHFEWVASQLGLHRVGWIFTDLVPLDRQKGTVKNLRNATTHFLTAQECIMAGYYQNACPNACRLSPEGYFGSKSVTVCVTGNVDNQVHMEGYQVSNQCMSLVRDDCLLPTKDAPELGYVKESSNQQYVPDVFFKEKDNFGNDVVKIARPLPVEYLLVDVPVSSPADPKYTFNQMSSKRSFPVENRPDSVQSVAALSSYLEQFDESNFLEAMSDFHLLTFLTSLELVPVRQEIKPLLEAIRDRDRTKASSWRNESSHWATLQQLIHAQGSNSHDEMVGPSLPAAVDAWNCNFCTFENKRSPANCEMCGLPRNQ